MRFTGTLLSLLLTLALMGEGGITAFGATPYDDASATSVSAEPQAAPARWAGVSLGTNLFLVGLSTGNLNLDFAINDHFSAGVNVALKAWPRWWAWDWDKNNDTRWKHILVEPQVRWWHKSVFDGWYLGVNAMWAHFNVGGPDYPFAWNYPALKEVRLQGDFNAYGMFTGYSWWLARRLRLELEAGILLGRYSAASYKCVHCGEQLGQESGPVVIPKLGLNLVINFTEKKEKQQQAREDVTAFIRNNNK